jgi:pyruvate kinase
MRRTKIICTLGPAVDDERLLRELMLKGMNAARFNFSHGTHKTHAATLARFKRVRDELGCPIPAILDTMGPEIRIGSFKESPIYIKKGDTFTLTTDPVEGSESMVSVSYKNLPMELKPGRRILIDDGLIELVVMEITGSNIVCVAMSGGELSGNKGINVPDIKLSLPSLTPKDIDDLKFAVENDFDFIAASFIRKASDVRAMRSVLDDFGGKDIRIISKIETREGIDNIDEIIEQSDAIMVARGDLGIEIPTFEVPMVQKSIIRKCYRAGKPVITATQMLDSMIRNPRPTRAEASDVANAVCDGTSCVMLSGETAAGKYPIDSLETITDIIDATESSLDYWQAFRSLGFDAECSITNAISHASCTTAMDLGAAAIIAVTSTGLTARMISRFRPSCPIIAITVDQKVLRQLSISWGVVADIAKRVQNTDELLEIAAQKALGLKVVSKGDLVVITAGLPVGMAGTTNLLKADIL